MLWKKLLILWQMFILVYYSNVGAKFYAIIKELVAKEFSWEKNSKAV